MSSDEEKRQDPQEPPNGGARAVGVALGAFAAQIVGWSVRVVGIIMLAMLIYAALVTKEFAPRHQKNMFLLSAFKQWPYILTNAGFLLALLGLYAPVFYISEYSLERGMSSQLALYQVAILNAPSF
ncbi:hypothetical protein V1515DRAFT_624463 [Lipomyces mesembrius]